MFLGCTRSSDMRTEDSSEQPTEELEMKQTFIGKPAGMALDHFKITFDDLGMHPHRGDLKALYFEAKKDGHTERVFLWLDGKDTHWPRGTWDIDTIRNLKVLKITSEQIDMEKSLVGQPAALALNRFKVGFDDLDMEDEPPGKLRAISFKVKKGDHTERLHLWLDYNLNLFSMNRDWDFKAIRKAKVIKITAELCFDSN
jgi:hypothetical protein